jgi:hypothetical protein
VLLLEVNSYPAIASGTMAAVPRQVYTRLVDDLLHLVVIPGLARAEAKMQACAHDASVVPQVDGFVRVL